jgi:hypothetical protein
MLQQFDQFECGWCCDHFIDHLYLQKIRGERNNAPPRVCSLA